VFGDDEGTPVIPGSGLLDLEQGFDPDAVGTQFDDPSLLVAHPFLGLEAKPDALVAVLASTFVRAGDLALGLTPLVLFFAATTDLGPAVFTALLVFVGGTALLGAARDLVAVEASPERQGRMRGLAAAWCALTVLGAARIGWEVMT
jgi:hypothetical protein